MHEKVESEVFHQILPTKDLTFHEKHVAGFRNKSFFFDFFHLLLFLIKQKFNITISISFGMLYNNISWPLFLCLFYPTMKTPLLSVVYSQDREAQVEN